MMGSIPYKDVRMVTSLSLTPLIFLFCFAAIVIWYAGVALSEATDAIDEKFGLAEAMGGLILLAFVTNLPEIAIVFSAAYTHQMGIVIGNILGGIAIQTVVLALLDGFGLGKGMALTYRASSPQLVLEGVLVVSVLLIAIMGTQLPQSLVYSRLAPPDILIVITWFVGLWLANKARNGLTWKQKVVFHPKRKVVKKHSSRTLFVFFLSALATLIAGVLLERSGSAIAAHFGLSGILFGSTILAGATALPEVSSGLAAIKLRDYTLAYSDIFGGNAFLPTLFLPATLLSGQAILPQAQNSDIYLASLGALLTIVYVCGLIFRLKKQIFRLGIDSFIVVIFYLIGLAGLFLIN